MPWHYNNIAAVKTVKQTLVGLDGIKDLVKLNRDGPSCAIGCASSRSAPCSSSRRCCEGGYFAAVEQGYFVDSGEYPETQRRRHRPPG